MPTTRFVAGLVAFAALSGCAATGGVSSLFDGADPAVLVGDSRVYLYPTGGHELAVWTSTDKVDWRREAVLLRIGDIPWIEDDGAPSHSLWAPHMVAADGAYWFYYSVGPQNPTPSRIGVARCETPTGPCVDSGRPLLTGGNGFEAIDPMVWVDPKTGQRLFYAGGSAGSTLRVYELGQDMVTLGRRIDVATPPHFTEGAFMHERDGIYYLSYSSGRYDDATYSVHYATAPSPTGPWNYRGVILQSDDRSKGPGHHAFFQDGNDGSWWIAYHRWEQPGQGPYRGSRRIVVERISYDANGLIVPIGAKR